MGWRPTRSQWLSVWLFAGVFFLFWLVDPTPRCPGCMGALEGLNFWQRALIIGAILIVVAVAHRFIGDDDE